MRILAPFALVITFSSVAEAQSVDILQQDVSVDLTNPDDVHIQLDILVEATGNATSLAMPKPLLPIITAEVDGVAATTGPHPSYPNEIVRVTYPTALTAGQQATVVITLAGEPSCGGTGAFCFHGPTETILTVSQPGSAWYHSDLFASDTFIGTVEVLAPSTFEVVAGQGDPSVIEPLGATQRWLFEIEVPTDLLGLYAGEADTILGEGEPPVTAVYHADSHDEEDVALAVETASEILPIFEEQYGALPVDRVYLITTPSSFFAGGLGMLGKVFFNAVVFTTHDYLVEQGVAHELAHSWWGNLASGLLSNESPFLNEGMAEYSAWRALGTSRGDAFRTAGMRMNAVWYQYRRPDNVDVPILSNAATSSPAYVHSTYHKGALVVRALEETIGAEAMGRVLARFVARGQGQLTIEGLIEDVEVESGVDATVFVEQWMRHVGYPLVVVTPTSVVSGEVALTIEVIGEFDLTLPIHFTLGDGTVLEEVVSVSAGVSQHSFTLAERPAAIAVDPAWTMPREVIAAYPTDVNHDAVVDAADLIEVALRQGTFLPEQRRVDGGYDPLFDIDRDRTVGDLDLEAVRQASVP